jgi:hypothetical protein
MNPTHVRSTFFPNPDIILREVDHALVLFDPHKDAVHTMNPTAQFVWEHIEIPPEMIVTALQNTYSVSTEVAQNDVQHILEQFQTLGLIQTNPPQ